MTPAAEGASDVVVVGDGPAGLAATAALARRGLAVVQLAAARAGWPNTYGVWVHELDEAEVPADQVLARGWPTVTVAFDADGEVALPCAYGLVDNAALQGHLRGRCRDGGVVVVEGRATGVAHDAAGSTVTTQTGRRLRARVVIDASGHRPALAVAGRGRPAAFQTAFGLRGRFSAPPVTPGTAVLMDHRTGDLPSDATATDPTFLYAMDLGGGRTFVEETCLARRPGLPLDELERRLRARLAVRGADVVEVEAVERCAFPMGGPLPPRDQRVVAFGAAAGMVHPATGYQVGAALRRAPRLAAALADALAGGGGPDEVAAAGWNAVWPRDLVRQRALHRFGLDTLLDLDGPAVRGFFRAFFGLPVGRWRGYLSGDRSAGAVAGTMLDLFSAAEPRLRRRLVGAGARHGVSLVAALR